MRRLNRQIPLQTLDRGAAERALRSHLVLMMQYDLSRTDTVTTFEDGTKGVCSLESGIGSESKASEPKVVHKRPTRSSKEHIDSLSSMAMRLCANESQGTHTGGNVQLKSKAGSRDTVPVN